MRSQGEHLVNVGRLVHDLSRQVTVTCVNVPTTEGFVVGFFVVKIRVQKMNTTFIQCDVGPRLNG